MTTTDGARATRLPREQRRQQVLAAALEIFSTVGYHAASMDDIADRAGVSKPVLYQHFTSKLDLYLDLLDVAIEDLLAAAREALTHTNDNRERVASWAAAIRWLRNPEDAISRADATELISSLAWRGIGGFPLTHPPQDDEPFA